MRFILKSNHRPRRASIKPIDLLASRSFKCYYNIIALFVNASGRNFFGRALAPFSPRLFTTRLKNKNITLFLKFSTFSSAGLIRKGSVGSSPKWRFVIESKTIGRWLNRIQQKKSGNLYYKTEL